MNMQGAKLCYMFLSSACSSPTQHVAIPNKTNSFTCFPTNSSPLLLTLQMACNNLLKKILTSMHNHLYYFVLYKFAGITKGIFP